MLAEDLNELITVHREAFSGYLNTGFGDNYILEFLRWFTLQNDTISLIALSNNQAAGYVAGAALGYNQRLTKSLSGTVFTYMLLHPWVILNKKTVKKLYARFKCLVQPTIAAKDPVIEGLKGISLVGIGVSNKARNKQVGSKLIEHFEKKASEMGFDYMRLSVFNSNNTAINFYLKNGWSLLERQGELSYFAKKLTQSNQ